MGLITDIRVGHQELTHWRRDLHRHPELAFKEHRTSDFVADKLASFGIEVHRGLASTGVVGVLRSGTSDRSIGLRADMDALPMQEENTFSHRSVHDGCFHGCGHDGHTVMLLGAARHLAANPDFDGTVFFIFQPAEEAAGGAKVMIDDGLFEQFPMASVYGMHNWPGLASGKFSVRAGAMMASFDRFDIELGGVGAHGAMPHEGVDSLLAASQLTLALQSIVSRNVDPLESAVVSVTQIHGGDAYNVLPAKAILRGGVRTFAPKVRDFVAERIESITSNLATAMGVKASVNYQRTYPALINSEQETAHAVQAASTLVGEANVDADGAPTMGSEDFAFMLEHKPGCYLFIGNGDGAGACMVHNPVYDFNDEILPLGAAYWCSLVELILPTGS